MTPLRRVWLLRDRRYGGRSLTDDEIRAIRWWRIREAAAIERTDLVAWVADWRPPSLRGRL